MAKKIKEIHDLVEFLTTKGRIGYNTAEEIDLAVYTASKWLYDFYYAMFDENNALHDSLRPFTSDPTVITLTNDQYILPVDFVHEIGDITAGGIFVDVVDRAAQAKRINNASFPPTPQHPICTFYNTYVQFFPTGLTNIKFAYLRLPVQPVYATTIVNGREVYDDSSSVDIEWNGIDITKVSTRALSILGINLEDLKLVEWSEAKEGKNE